jgi:hypothetical protein
MLVTGGPPVRGGGGMPHRIIISSRPSPSFCGGEGRAWPFDKSSIGHATRIATGPTITGQCQVDQGAQIGGKSWEKRTAAN